jgi:hypothetical protein
MTYWRDLLVASYANHVDIVDGGSGNDTIYASSDGGPDFIDCGRYASPNSIFGDDDTAYADTFDQTVNCEHVVYP